MNDIWDVIYNYTNIATDVYHKTVSKCEGKTINESIEENPKINLAKKLIYELFSEVSDIKMSMYDDKPLIKVFFTSNSAAANEESWFAKQICDTIMEYTSGDVIIAPWWAPNWDRTKKMADLYLNTELIKYNDDDVMNESENKKSNYINLIKELVEPFKNEDCVCDIDVLYDEEDDMYSVYVVASTKELREKFFYVDGIQQYILKLRVNINKTIVGYLPIENLYVGSYGKPNCEWNPTISEAHKVDKDEYVELYRDKDFILTIPLTHETSKKYGSDTKWCTTKKDCNKDFKKHTELGVLGYIVVRDKELKERLGSNAFALYRLKGDDITRTIAFDDQNNEYRNGESWLGNKFDIVDKLFQFYKMMNKYNDYFEKQDTKETIEESKEISKKDLSEEIKYNKVNNFLNVLHGIDTNNGNSVFKVDIYASQYVRIAYGSQKHIIILNEN
jgi:hypothetical protein